MDVNLLDGSGYQQGQPWNQLRWIQEHSRAFWHADPGSERGFWVVTHYADVKAVEADYRTFASFPTITLYDDQSLYDTAGHRQLMVEDPPDHTPHRKFVGHELTPQSVRAMESGIQAIADEIIDDVIERGECELVGDIAGLLASYVTADLLGIPREQAVRLYRASEILNNRHTYAPEIAQGAIGEIQQTAADLYADRTSCPRHDTATRLTTREVNGQPVDLGNFAFDVLLLLAAAGDTTRNVVAGGMQALFENPAEREILMAAVAADDADALATGVEEMLRWVAPVVYVRRTATADAEIAGQPVAAGDKITVFYGIANRDPAVFADPWRFDVRRSPNPHITFGFGSHYCLGSHLARLELNLMFRSLLRRMPDMEPAGPVQWVHAAASTIPSVVGPRAIPVRFTPGPRSAPPTG
jgi:cytochrome P450